MTLDQRMVNAIREYRASLSDPEKNWPDSEFDRLSYYRWGLDEILCNVLAHPEWTVIRAVEDMKDQFYKFSMVSTSFYEANYIFEVAYNAASDMSDILNAMV